MSPPLLGELCGPHHSAWEQKFESWPDPTLTAAGLWLLGAFAASLLPHRSDEILRAAVAEVRNPSQIARSLWARAPGQLGGTESAGARPNRTRSAPEALATMSR
jgi:hypothetical protein